MDEIRSHVTLLPLNLLAEFIWMPDAKTMNACNYSIGVCGALGAKLKRFNTLRFRALRSTSSVIELRGQHGQNPR
jgi:hypothetical protein